MIKSPERIRSYFIHQWPTILAIIVTGVLFNGTMVFIAITQGWLIDSVVAGQIDKIYWMVAIFLSTIIGIQTMRFLKRLFVRKFANRANQTMRNIAYHNILRQPLSRLESSQIGDVMTKIVGDVDITVEGMRKVTTEIFDTGILLITYVVTLLIYDVPLTLMAIIFVPLGMLLARSLKKVIYKTSKAYRNQMSQVTGQTYELTGHTILLRTHGALSSRIEDYDRSLASLQKKAVRANALESGMPPVYLVIASIGVIAVLYVGGLKVIDGGWTIGTFLAYLTMFTAMTVKTSKSAKLFNSFQKATISWQRVKPFLSEIKPDDPSHSVPKVNQLEVQNLSFRYPNSKDNIIENLSFSAKKGEIIGITGPIACGKSALGIALLGLFPHEGEIRLDNIELSSFNEVERSQLLSYQGHNPWLLSDTVRANVTLGKDGPLDKVFETVDFLYDLKNMPEGEQTLVGSSGVRLSGGQQARIALARALFTHAPVIILDDPFSAVDTLTEHRIIERLRADYQDSIIFIISHRLSVFPLVNRIIMFEHGFQIGNHDELLVKSSLYKRIFDLQRGMEK